MTWYIEILISTIWSMLSTHQRTPGLLHSWYTWLLLHITALALQLILGTLKDSFSYREGLLHPRSDCWTSDSSYHNASNHGTWNFQQVKQASVSLKIVPFLPLLVFTRNITQIKNKQLSENFTLLCSVLKATTISIPSSSIPNTYSGSKTCNI